MIDEEQILVSLSGLLTCRVHRVSKCESRRVVFYQGFPFVSSAVFVDEVRVHPCRGGIERIG